MISARSTSHSFDPSQINVSHYVSQFSFGRRLSSDMLYQIKRLAPLTGDGHDRLAGKSYITHNGESNTDITVIISPSLYLSLLCTHGGPDMHPHTHDTHQHQIIPGLSIFIHNPIIRFEPENVSSGILHPHLDLFKEDPSCFEAY